LEITLKKSIYLVVSILAVLLFSCSKEEKEFFSLIVLPDTQNYAREFPCVYLKQTEWIVKNKDTLRILFVAHEGDVVDDCSSIEQWQHADRAMSVLDGEIPYSITTGNHDIDYNAKDHRGTKNFDTYFPVTRFTSWCSGYYKDSIKNSYYLIKNESIKLLLITLEFGPTEDVVQWADAVLQDHQEYNALVVTHCYMFCDNTRVGKDDCWTTSSYLSGGQDGDQLWESLISKHDHIFLVQSGHILGDGLGRLTSLQQGGGQVHQVLANYQMKQTGGNGWLRIMKFYPAENEIRVYTYSPLFDKYKTDPENQFILTYNFK
jgi:hypothetical protein